MPNDKHAEKVRGALDRIVSAVLAYHDGFTQAQFESVFQTKIREAISLRLEQFSLREDITSEQLYHFIATDVLAELGDTYRGSALEFDVLYTPKDVMWSQPGRTGKPRGFFATRRRLAVQNDTATPELVTRRDLAWRYQTTPGTLFAELVDAVVALMPLAVDDVLRSIR